VTDAQHTLARVLQPGYLEGLEKCSLEDLRAKHIECVELENTLSYVRRLAQGRLDILGAEDQRRATGGSVDELVASLPKILAGRDIRPGSAQTRVPPHLGPDGVELPPELARFVADDTLARLPTLSDDELRTAREELADLEERVSTDRRDLHGVIDRIEHVLAGRLAVEA